MEVIIDSSVIIDSLEEITQFSNIKKKEDRLAIEKIIDLKQNNQIICIRTINAEFEIAKEIRQEMINKKWGEFPKRDIGIGLKASLSQKYYNQKWDQRFNELKGDGERNHIDASIFVQAEYFNIKYIISTDYEFINRYRGKSEIVEVIRPIDFIGMHRPVGTFNF